MQYNSYDKTLKKRRVRRANQPEMQKQSREPYVAFAAANSGGLTNTVTRLAIDTTSILENRCLDNYDGIYSSSVHWFIESTAYPPLLCMHCSCAVQGDSILCAPFTFQYVQPLSIKLDVL